MTDELRPCPFCGGTDAAIVMTKRVFDNALGYLVMCADCGGAVGLNVDTEFTAFTDFGTEAEAIEAWNTRAEQETHDVSDRPLRFMCDACGGVSLEIAPSYCPCCGRKVVDR